MDSQQSCDLANHLIGIQFLSQQLRIFILNVEILIAYLENLHDYKTKINTDLHKSRDV